MRIALSTGGGDAPGLNAVIRAATLSALNRGWEVLGIKRGYYGLLGEDEVVPMTRDLVAGIGHLGGTILRTTNRGNPFHYPVPDGQGGWREVDRSDEVVANARALGIDAVITIGGDGSLAIAQIEAIDKLHTTAESHDRVMVIELMGREAGFIALHAGVSATADVVLIPEIPFDLDVVCEKIRARDLAGRRFSIVVVAEGAMPIGGTTSILGPSMPGQAARLGGLAGPLARLIQEKTGKEARSLVLGHLQRGGQPTGYDRLLATRFGGEAVRAVADGRWGHMVALHSPHIVTIPIEEALRETKRVDPHHDVVRTARACGISFGDHV
ncbi:MAG: 6-phosphofructokinase [Gemmatimonadaceae bacterium]|nr:6-phosphofructokinase [Gemmatimonadaceae bacterium]